MTLDFRGQLDSPPLSPQVSAVLPQKLVRGAANCHCRCRGNALHICLHHLSLLICFQLRTLFGTSQSPPVLSTTRNGLGVDFAFRLWPSSLSCFWRQIPSRCQTLNLSNLPPDLRCSCLACCWLCSCLACCWLCSSALAMLFSRSTYPCCFLPSSHHWLFGCGSVSASSSVTLW